MSSSGATALSAATASAAEGPAGSARVAGGAAAAAGRVAQAGNGKETASGTGISGWATNIVPGLAIVARSLAVGGSQPYSARAASAGSRRPATRTAQLATM